MGLVNYYEELLEQLLENKEKRYKYTSRPIINNNNYLGLINQNISSCLCAYCSVNFKKIEELKKHIAVHHAEEYYNVELSIDEVIYRIASEYFNNYEFYAAKYLFGLVMEYKDSSRWTNICNDKLKEVELDYLRLCDAEKDKKYSEAIEICEKHKSVGIFNSKLEDILEQKEKDLIEQECSRIMIEAQNCMERGDFQGIENILFKLKKYNIDSYRRRELEEYCRCEPVYIEAKRLIGLGHKGEAERLFNKIIKYKDSCHYRAKCKYRFISVKCNSDEILELLCDDESIRSGDKIIIITDDSEIPVVVVSVYYRAERELRFPVKWFKKLVIDKEDNGTRMIVV